MAKKVFEILETFLKKVWRVCQKVKSFVSQFSKKVVGKRKLSNSQPKGWVNIIRTGIMHHNTEMITSRLKTQAKGQDYLSRALN